MASSTCQNFHQSSSHKTESATSDYTICGNADKVIARKRKVEYKQVFGEYKSGELVFVKGRPGSGKTTLVHKIIKDWTKGDILRNAKLTFLIILRILNCDTKEETLSSVLQLFYHNLDELKKLTTSMEREDGEGVCFIIDGLDEYQSRDKNNSIIYRLLEKTYLPMAMIIVLCRPAATEEKL